MASIHQIRGMLLEEAVLALLNTAGYRAVDKANDSTLTDGKSGLEVRGRGCCHQVDAVADYLLSPPFSHQQRLLVEAKFQGDSVGTPILRNALGVLKDVTEYWTGKDRTVRQPFHYQYAICSASRFTPEAEAYAHAHG